MIDPASGRPAATATPPIPGATTATPDALALGPAALADGPVGAPSLLERVRAFRQRHAREESLAFFAGGFLFDAVMVGRIDETPVLVQQAAYLVLVGVLLGAVVRMEALGLEPPRFLRVPWRYVEHALHFLLGTLLNAYVLFYVKSGSGLTALLFLVIISALLAVNEMPRFHRLGPVVVFALWSFALTSYLAYLLPVLLGHLSPWMFFAASVLSFVPVGLLAWRMKAWEARAQGVAPGDALPAADAGAHRAARVSAFRQAVWPAVAVQALLLGLFLLRLVPPVPLSVRSIGVWHDVKREGSEFVLARLPRPGLSLSWRKDEPVFHARPGDRVNVFTRIFAPRNFRDQVRVRWARWDPARRTWEQSDAIPLRIVGGREEGFGGWAFKQHWQPGDWNVSVETEDGREIGRTRFEIRADLSTDTRVFDLVRD